MFSDFYELDLHNKIRVHQQIYDETHAKPGLKIIPPLLSSRLLKVHFCWFSLIGYIDPPHCVNYWKFDLF
jgi:hypothetical protein